MTESNYLTQTQLAERWQVAESTLERWRSEGIGPIYMKMMGRVRYRLSDITDFEEDIPFAGARRSAHPPAVTGNN
jgi:predicted site-specific integrase-resolvase